MMRRLVAICILCSAAAFAGDAPLFPDANLENVVRAHVIEKRESKEPLTMDDVKNLSSLTSRGNPIKNLTGLDKCTALGEINISGAELSELGPIRTLLNMASLTLRNDRIKDISPLSGMTRLQYLDLDDNQIADLTPLAGLTSLNTLSLANNKVADLTPLKNATRLWSLYLAGNQITDLHPISGLKALSSLDLTRNRIKDLSPLTGLTGLRYLLLEGNPVSDLAPLVSMAKRDAEGEKQFAPYLSVYLSPGQGSAAQVAELKKYVHDVHIAETKTEDKSAGKGK
jgi:internalin A